MQTVALQSHRDWTNFAFITLKDLIAGQQLYVTVADIFLPRIKTGGKKCERDPPFYMLWTQRPFVLYVTMSRWSADVTWLRNRQSKGVEGCWGEKKRLKESMLTCCHAEWSPLYSPRYFIINIIFFKFSACKRLKSWCCSFTQIGTCRTNCLFFLWTNGTLLCDSEEQGALHLDMSLGLQLTHPSLGNWWELCFHSNSLLPWFVHLGFTRGKRRRW